MSSQRRSSDDITSNKSEESDNVSQLLTNMAKSSSARRTAQRTTLSQAHTTRIAAARAKIDAHFSRRDEEARKRHKAHLTRLVALLRQKHDLEARLMACVERLQTAYTTRAQALMVVMAGRAADLAHVEGVKRVEGSKRGV